MSQDSFVNAQARLGYGAGSQADASGYAVDYLSRNRFRLEAMYRSSWICGKAVDAIAEDMTKRGVEIQSEADPQQIDALTAQWKRLRVWDALSDTIKWSRLYGGAVAVLLVDGQNLTTPLRVDRIGRDAFKGLLVLDRWQLQPSLQQLVTDLGPDLGLPQFYSTVGATQGAAQLPQTKIHYSRVIRLDGQDLPFFQRISENGWGQSVLERLFDRLLAFDSTTQGAAQLVYKAHLRTYKVEGLRDIIAQGGAPLEGLTKQIEFLRQTQTNEGLTLMDKEDEFEAHSYSFGGLDVVLLQFAQQLSGALNIPLTRLFGQSPAGLSATGESDLRTYYDGIEQEQERRLRADVAKLLAVSYRSLFGKDLPDGSDFTFRPLWQHSELEKAQMAASTTAAITQAQTSLVIGRQTALKELRQASRVTGVFSNITDEMIEAADDDVDAGEFGATGDPFGAKPEDDKEAKTSVSRQRARDDDFKESEHPRNDQGEFTSGGHEIGPHGPIFREHTGNWPAARDRLLAEKTGEVPGALTHKATGPIDVVYGGKKHGLAKIAARHPEVLGDLQGIFDQLEEDKDKHTDNSIQLTNEKYHALVRRNWKGDPKVWLLTAFGKE